MTGGHDASEHDRSAALRPDANNAAPQLIVYCRSWCGDCKRAKAWLQEQGIDFVEIDVDDDAVARERAAGHNDGRLHTPTFELGDEVCVDFRPERVLGMLGPK